MPAPAVSASRPRLWVAAGLGVALVTAAGIAGSATFVRRAAAGHLHGEWDVPPAPVALVLGAAVSPEGVPSAFLTARLELARRLFVTGKVRVILVSGDNLAPDYNEPLAMRRHLLAAGVPPDRVVVDYAGFDTYDSCVRAAKVFGVSHLIVVTQSYHLPRAVATCRRLGLQADGVGDNTARAYRGAWWRGALRDQVACVKTVVDLATRRRPVLGRRQPGVDRALLS